MEAGGSSCGGFSNGGGGAFAVAALAATARPIWWSVISELTMVRLSESQAAELERKLGNGFSLEDELQRCTLNWGNDSEVLLELASPVPGLLLDVSEPQAAQRSGFLFCFPEALCPASLFNELDVMDHCWMWNFIDEAR